MYKINRRSISSGRSIPAVSPSHIFSSSLMNNKVRMNKMFNDNSKLSNKLAMQRLNMSKLSNEENIEQLNAIKKKRESLNQNKINNGNTPNNITNNANSTFIHNGHVLPTPPAYKPHKEDEILSKDPLNPVNLSGAAQLDSELTAAAIDQLPHKVVETSEDMARVFNAIMNNTDIDEPNKQVPAEQQTKQTEVKEPKQDIPIDKKLYEISQKLRTEILDEKMINYLEIVKIIYDLSIKFANNSMKKPMMQRALDRYNRTQLIKLPSDRLKDVIDMILSSL